MIQSLLTWLGLVDERPAQLDTIDLFLSGHSIPAVAASQGGDMIHAQRAVEQQIRSYILGLEQQISELQAQL